MSLCGCNARDIAAAPAQWKRGDTPCLREPRRLFGSTGVRSVSHCLTGTRHTFLSAACSIALYANAIGFDRIFWGPSGPEFSRVCYRGGRVLQPMRKPSQQFGHGLLKQGGSESSSMWHLPGHALSRRVSVSRQASSRGVPPTSGPSASGVPAQCRLSPRVHARLAEHCMCADTYAATADSGGISAAYVYCSVSVWDIDSFKTSLAPRLRHGA